MADNSFGVTDLLSQPSTSFYDQFLKNRQLLEQQSPAVAAQMPTLGANTPGQRMFDASQQQPAQDLASSLEQVKSVAAQNAAGPQAKPKDAQNTYSSIDQILSYLDPLKPAQTYGPNIGKSLGMPDNAGGILGLGIQPIDVLAFALGAAATRNLPQDKAIATTMAIAGLPKAFRDNQDKSARQFLQAQQEAINSQIAGGNLQMRGVESALRIKAAQDQQNYITGLTSRLQSGTPLTPLEQQVWSIGAKKAGIDPNVIKDILLKRDVASQLSDLKDLSEYAKNNNLGSVTGTITSPGGASFKIGAGGTSGRSLQTGELGDALATGKNTDKLLQAGFDVTTPEGRQVVQNAYDERKRLEQARLNISQQGVDIRQKELEMPRPEEDKKLSALIELHRGAADMQQKYEASLASHGGKLSPGVQTAIQLATTSPEGMTGKVLQAIGQRIPGLTQQDLDFVARYATMQKFARGSLNDVGNLSNYERGIFNTMIGTPLDRPEVFRSRVSTALSDAEAAYNQEYRALGKTRDLGAYPSSLGAPKQQSGGATGQPPAGATVWRIDPKTGQLVK